MKNKLLLSVIFFLLIFSGNVSAQWTYINSIQSCLDKNFKNYETWLKNNDYHLTNKYDKIVGDKAVSMGSIYGIELSAKVYESKSQPTKVHCFTDSRQNLRSIDIFLINPKAGEWENIQLVLLKSGFKLITESRNENDKSTRTYYQKNNIRLNLSSPDDRSFLTITAGTLNNYE